MLNDFTWCIKGHALHYVGLIGRDAIKEVGVNKDVQKQVTTGFIPRLRLFKDEGNVWGGSKLEY